MSTNRRPDPLSAPGPVFSDINECINCQACLVEAPDLMGVTEESVGCFFRKQPKSEAEWQRAARASRTSCVGAIHCTDPAASLQATGKTWNELGLEFMNSPRPAIPESLCEKCTLPKFAIEDALLCLHCETGFSVETTKAVIYLSPQPQRFLAKADGSDSRVNIVLLARKVGFNTWIRIDEFRTRLLRIFK